MLNWHKDGRFGPELNWVLVEMVIRGYPFKLLWFCDVCVLYYVAVKKLGLIAYFLLVYFGFNFLIGIYPFEHLCFFCVCVTVLRICDFGIWIKLGFVELLCLWKVLIDACSRFQPIQLSQLINKFNKFFLIKKKERKIFS